jgi:signal transduction histidine kinase
VEDIGRSLSPGQGHGQDDDRSADDLLLAHVQTGQDEAVVASVGDELREISRGIHPAILSEGGLEPALSALRRRSAVPVELDVHAERRLPAPVEVAAYYVVAEALTNAAKHARASAVHVELDTHDAILRLAIRDDGIGEPTSARGPDCSGSAIESKPSAARSRSPALPATAPRC